MFSSSIILSFFLLNVNQFGENFLAKCDEFSDLFKQPYFVDKSLFLQKYFSKESELVTYAKERTLTPVPNYYYFSCPRGFGKTTNLQMLRRFAQFEVKHNLTTIRLFHVTKAYQEVFSKLKINNYTQLLRKHMSQYGVIYLDLTFEPDELVNETMAEKSFVAKLGQSFESYEWFWSVNLTSRAIGTVRHIAYGNISSQSIFRGLYCMGQVLAKFNPRGIILLVDNFDSAARASVSRPGLAVRFLYNLIYKTIDKLLQVNIAPPKGDRFNTRTMCIVTGITTLYFDSADFKNSAHFKSASFLTPGYFSPYFGFVQSDVDVLLTKYNCTDEEKSAVANYYKGYRTDNGLLALYNPISVIGYVNSKRNSSIGKLEPYWARNESIDFIVDFAKASLFRAKLQELCTRNTFKVSSPFKNPDPHMFISFLESNSRNYQEMLDEDVPSLLYYFYQHGFLKHATTHTWGAFAFATFEVKTETMRKLEERGVSLQ